MSTLMKVYALDLVFNHKYFTFLEQCLACFFCLGQLALTKTMSRNCLRVDVICDHPNLNATNLVWSKMDF